MMIVWDAPKREANLDKHGLDFADLTLEFFATAVVTPGRKGRFQAIGGLAGKTVSAIFRPLGREAISIISLRPAAKKERRGLR